MKTSYLFLATCTLTWRVLISQACAADVAEDAAIQEVKCVEIEFAESVANSDMQAFGDMIHRDARFVGNEVARGRDEVLRAWAPFFEPEGPRIIWRPEFVEVLQSGDLALSRGPYRLQITEEDGNVREEWGTYNSIWQRQPGGIWQVIFDAGSPGARPLKVESRRLIEEPEPGCEEYATNK